MSKLDLVVVLVAVAGGALLIEHGHHVDIEAPAAEASQLSAAMACPENDTEPYDARCLEFLKVPPGPAPRLQVTAVREVPVRAAPCPDNDKVPYSASCIAFLKGATETNMRWRVTDGQP